MNGFVSRALTALGAAGTVAVWAPAVIAQEEEPAQAECPPNPPPPNEARPKPRPHRMDARPSSEVVTYAEQSPNSDLITGGALMFGLSYGTSVMLGAASDRHSDQWLFVPVAGPWLDLATRRSCHGPNCGIGEAANKVLLAGDGILQAAGTLQILGGFLFPETRIVTRTASRPQVHVAPTAGLSSVGLTAWGTF